MLALSLRRAFGATTLALVASLALFGCGKDTSDGDIAGPPPGGDPDPSNPEPQPAPAPVSYAI